MDENTHGELMQLATASRLLAADVSESATGGLLPRQSKPELSEILELGFESLLEHFRRK